jgi:hypothetical protein
MSVQTFIAGKTGYVGNVAGTPGSHTEMTAALTVWTGVFPMQIFDITQFGNVGWRNKLGGLMDANGSAGGFATSKTSADTLAAITGRNSLGTDTVLGYNSTCYIAWMAAGAASCLLSNIRSGADVNDVARVTFDWEGSGHPEVTWATS